MDRDSNKSLIVGIFTFLMLVVSMVLIIWQSDIFRKVTGYELVGRFDHIGGLIDGAAVRYRGYTIGHVVYISPLPIHIDVKFFVDGQIEIPDDSKVKIMFDGLVGENYIQIEPGLNVESFLQDGDIINGKSGSDLANFIDLGSQNLVQSEAILTHLRSFLMDPILFSQIKRIISNVHDISTELSSLSKGELASLLRNANDSIDAIQPLIDSVVNEESLFLIHDSIKKFHATTVSLAELESMTSTLSDPETIGKITTILGNLEDVSSDLQMLVGGVGESSPLASFRNLKLSTNTHVSYAPTISRGYFDTMVGIDNGRFGLIGGIGNRFGDINFQHFQQSYRFSSLLRSRFGIIHNSEGVGVDFYPRSNISLSANFYDFNNRYFSLSSAYNLNDYLNFELVYRKDSLVDQGGIDLGINLDI